MIQFDVGRRHDGLAAVVGLRRHGNNRLLRVSRFPFLRQWFPGTAGVQRRKVFGRCVVDDVGAMESRSAHHLRALWPELYGAQYCRDGCDVAEHREPKPAPRETRGYENIWPKRARCRRRLEGGTLIPAKQVEQVVEKNAMPGGQINQESRRRRGFWQGFGCGFQKHGSWFHQLGRSGKDLIIALTVRSDEPRRPDAPVGADERRSPEPVSSRCGDTKKNCGGFLRRTGGAPAPTWFGIAAP